MEKITIQTEGMACAKCEARMVENLSKLPGVSNVTATAANGLVTVEGSGINRETIAAAIEDLGCDVVE